MEVGKKLGLIVIVAMLAGLGGVYGEASAADLLVSLERGEVWAQFRGAGESAIQGVVGRSAYGPGSLTISPGTQFWGQRPGVQGMTTLGAVHIDLSQQRLASVRIPAACTRYWYRRT